MIDSFSTKSYLQAGMFFLITIFLITAVFSILVIILPLAIFKRKDIKDIPGKHNIIIYFSLLGLSFTIIEVCYIQKFIIFIGAPAYAFSTIVATLLIFSSLGSFTSARIKDAKSFAVFLALGLYIISGSLFMDPVFAQFMHLPRMSKIIISMLIISPAGFLMGMPFPFGIRALSDWKPALIPWMWGVNGVMAVLGSSIEVFLAMYVGFNATLVLTGLLYIAALFFLNKTRATATLPQVGE